MFVPKRLAGRIQKHHSNAVFYALLFDECILVSCHIKVTVKTTIDEYSSALAAISACVIGWPRAPVLVGGDFNTGFGMAACDFCGFYSGASSPFSAALSAFCIQHNLIAINSLDDKGA